MALSNHLCLTFFVAVLVGCFLSFDAVAGTEIRDSIRTGGMVRQYTLFLPTSYNGDRPLPLIINLHARCSNMQEHITYTNMNAAADTAGFIVVFPQGLEDPNDPFDCLDWNDNGRHSWDDVAFISTLIDSLLIKYRVAPNQVYACGFSRGGAMCYTLACTLGAKISGIAVISGGFSIKPLISSPKYSCAGARSFPLLIMHGDQDPDINYNGYPDYWAPIDSILAFFQSQNQCTKGLTTEILPDIDASDNSSVVRVVYDSCSLTFYRIEGARHSWSGSQGQILIEIPPKNMDINASVEILNFFRRINTTTSVRDASVSMSCVAYPNPFWDRIMVANLDPSSQLALYNSLGDVLWRGTNIAEHNLSWLPSGIYFLRISDTRATQTVTIMK